MIRRENAACTFGGAFRVHCPGDFYVAFRENFRTFLWVFSARSRDSLFTVGGWGVGGVWAHLECDAVESDVTENSESASHDNALQVSAFPMTESRDGGGVLASRKR